MAESVSSSSQKSRDPGWKYSYLKNENDKNAVTCNFCHKETKGGIHRFKQHLIGGFRNAASCKKVPPAVREEMVALLQNSKKKKIDRNVSESFDDEDLDGEDSVQDIVCLGAQSSAKRPRNFGPMDAFVSKKSKNMVQTIINAQVKKQERERVVQLIARWFYQAGIAFNTVKLKSFKDMLEGVGQFGVGLKPPSYHELRVPLLKKEVDITKEYLEKHRVGWKQYGCTVMADGWKDRRGRSLINFMVNSPLGTVFLESVDASSFVKTGSKLCELFENVFQKIGVENIVQVVTDNGSNFVLAGKMLEGKYRHLFWTPCAAHCIDLMLEDMSKEISLVRTTIVKAMKLSGFIYNHGMVLSMMRKFTKQRDLVRPGVTRFATAFLTLQSIHDHRNELRMMFTSEDWVKSKWVDDPKGRKVCDIALNSSFWNNVLHVLKLGAPLVKVLRLVDSDEKPAMGYIYEAIGKAKVAIKNSMNGDEKKYEKLWNIIDCRWHSHLSNPLHLAAYFLNPMIFYSDPNIQFDQDVGQGFLSCIERLSQTPQDQDKILHELDVYKQATGMIGCDMAIRQRTQKQPALWWGTFGLQIPHLQKLAMRILSLTCSSSGCERNWSVFENIHNKKRNRLEAKKLNDLVFVRYNQRLRDRFENRGKYDPICLDNIDDCDEWIANAAQNDLVFEGEDLTWADVEEAAGLNIDPRPNTRSRSSRGKEPMVEEEKLLEEYGANGGDDEEYDDTYDSGDGNGNGNENAMEDLVDLDEGEGLF